MDKAKIGALQKLRMLLMPSPDKTDLEKELEKENPPAKRGVEPNAGQQTIETEEEKKKKQGEAK